MTYTLVAIMYEITPSVRAIASTSAIALQEVCDRAAPNPANIFRMFSS
ncbi:hypothetical protein [Coleofasciculus chthonoplastes]